MSLAHPGGRVGAGPLLSRGGRHLVVESQPRGCSVSRSGRGLLSAVILKQEHLRLLAAWARVC